MRTEQEEACRIAPMRPLTTFFARRNYDETTTSPLLGAAEDLDASLLDVNEELDIALRDIQQQAAVRNYTTTNKERVGHLIRCLETKKGVNTARAYQHAIAFRQFEICIRVKGMSELQAGRFVAETCYGDQHDGRSNATSTRVYRYRARALIVGYRYFLATGTLLLDRRGKCQGKSHVYDPVVKAWCREIISEFPNYFSARTFRDKVSAKLATNGYIKQNSKIGRSVTTFYLHQLGLHLACPKKGIYKDGNERPDTVQARREKWGTTARNLFHF